MGGFGSGKSPRCKRGKKLLTTCLPGLNFFELGRLHSQKPNGFFAWRDFKLTVKDGRVFLEQSAGGQAFEVELTPTPCNYGGFRYYAHCRYCKRRAKSLYLCIDIMACRRCLRLAYPTQNTTLEVRLYWKHSQLKERIGSAWKKPKWMRWPTFNRLRREYLDLEEKGNLAGFFALRNNRQLEKKFTKCPCAIVAIEQALEKVYGNIRLR